MILKHSTTLTLSKLTVFVCFAFGACNGTPAQTPEINKIWTTVGSTGTVDEADVSRIFFDRSVAQLGRVTGGVGSLPGASTIALPPQTLTSTIRYNVTPVEGLFAVEPPCFTQTGNSCPGIQLKLRYLAFGSVGRVVANLVEVDLVTGVEVTRLSFDSKSFASASGYQVQAVGQCGPSTPPQPFDFEKKAYYVEAKLTINATQAGSAAGIQIIKVANVRCIG